MLLKINGTEIAAYPEELKISVEDIDSENTQRTADGTIHRDRIAVKRQVEMSFGVLTLYQISSILQATSSIFFDLYYPDPLVGDYTTKTMYISNRSTVAAIEDSEGIKYKGLQFTLIEQ